MKGNTVFKIFCTLLIAVVASFAVTVFSDSGSEEYSTLNRDRDVVAITDPILPVTDDPIVQTVTEPEDTTLQTAELSFDTVYVTATGTKYHLAGCSYLRSSANEITLEDAEAKGYTPCSRCFK